MTFFFLAIGMMSFVTLWIMGYLKPVKMWNHIINSLVRVQNVGEHFLKDQTTGCVFWFCPVSCDVLCLIIIPFRFCSLGWVFYCCCWWVGTTDCDTGRDKTNEASTSALQETFCHSEKLFGVWNSNDQKQGRVLVAKLYKTCEMDVHLLFGYLNSPINGSNMASSDQQGPLQTIEYEKVLHLYSVFTKVNAHIYKVLLAWYQTTDEWLFSSMSYAV